MTSQNILCGPGVARAALLSSGCRRNGRSYNSGVKFERREARLGLSKTVRHQDLVEGDLISILDGAVVPLDQGLKFGGIIEAVAEGSQGYYAVLISRAAVSAKVKGLTGASREGDKIYAVPELRTQCFTIDANDGVLVGEILALEDLGQSRAIVGIRLEGDDRPFAVMGPRPR